MAAQSATKRAPRKAATRRSTLADALAKARAEVAVVAKLGENSAQRYRYARAEDIVREARKALAGAGLTLTDEVSGLSTERIESRNGAVGRLTDVKMRYYLTYAESGESIEREWAGSGSDYPGDKATYKAITGAHKYFLMHLLEIPLGDDPEDERAAEPARKTKTKTAGGGAKPEVVNAIGKKVADLSLGFDRLRTLIGSVGGTAPTINRSDSIAKALRALDAEQAAQLLALIEGE